MYTLLYYDFQDDVAERPRMASAISSLANYSAALPAGPSDPDSKAPEKANLGTLMGVYLPCIQNIFGVILFIRMTWIVGTAGAIGAFFVVFLACTVVSHTIHTILASSSSKVCILHCWFGCPTRLFENCQKKSHLLRAKQTLSILGYCNAMARAQQSV